MKTKLLVRAGRGGKDGWSPVVVRQLPQFPSLLQSAEDQRREALNDSDSFADSYYDLRDDGRNPDGSGESYAERNT